MASITITVQSLANSAKYDQYIVDDGITVSALKTAILANTGFATTWYVLYFNGTALADGNTLVSYGITTGSRIQSANKISDLATKADRQVAKLALASIDRLASGRRSTSNINQLPNPYNGNSSSPDDGAATLITGRPWT